MKDLIRITTYLVENFNRCKIRERYYLKVEINDNFVNMYKVHAFDDEIKDIVFSIEVLNDKLVIYACLDEDTEYEILESLLAANYNYVINYWCHEFKIVCKNFDELKNFFEKHVWDNDFGELY